MVSANNDKAESSFHNLVLAIKNKIKDNVSMRTRRILEEI